MSTQKQPRPGLSLAWFLWSWQLPATECTTEELEQQARRLHRQAAVLLVISMTFALAAVLYGLSPLYSTAAYPFWVLGAIAGLLFLAFAVVGIRADFAHMESKPDYDWDILNGVGWPKQDRRS